MARSGDKEERQYEDTEESAGPDDLEPSALPSIVDALTVCDLRSASREGRGARDERVRREVGGRVRRCPARRCPGCKFGKCLQEPISKLGGCAISPRQSDVGPQVPEEWELTRSGGPRPFVSWRTYRLPDHTYYTWESRHHRKGAGPRAYADRVGLRVTSEGEDASTKSPWLRFWAPHRLAWWVAGIFVIGSVFFVVGAAGSLVPEYFGSEHRMSVFAESCYFVGATLYTVSIYGQLLESTNADKEVGPDRHSHTPKHFRWFAFEITHLEFLVPFVLLLGSLVFNYETVFSLGSTFELLPRLGLWATSLLGAALFLASGVLQFTAT